jgi:hypothetical protein
VSRTFGAIDSTDELPFYEQFYYVGAGTVANNSSTNYAIGTVVMPWDGELYANFTVVYSWTGYQQIATHLSNSSPTSSSTSFMTQVGGSGTLTRGQLPIYATWQGLLKGQVVSLVALCLAGGGGPSVAFEGIAGTVRATRGGLEGGITP